MFASLPMYCRPENRAAHDALWSGIRDVLGEGPDTLDHETDYAEGWARPDLLLGQICNLPYRAKFRDTVTRVASADYGLPDTPAGYYHSVFVVRSEDAPRGLAPAMLGRFAYNDALSHSGWGAPRAFAADKGLTFHTKLRTGAHRASLAAVANGDADLAAVDGVTWRMAQQWDDNTKGLSVVGRTGLSPGMTFITGKDRDPAPIFAALKTAVADLAPVHRDTLGLRGITTLPDTAYDIALPPAP